KVDTVNGRVRIGGSVPDELAMAKALDIVGQYGSPTVINTMTIAGGRQVNLEVRIREAQRDAGRQLGISWRGSAGGFQAGIGGVDPSAPSQPAESFSSFITQIISGAAGVNLSAMIN